MEEVAHPHTESRGCPGCIDITSVRCIPGSIYRTILEWEVLKNGRFVRNREVERDRHVGSRLMK
jgi:hypothetical protein